MEDYAEELRTPPVALVSLVGMPELHQPISTFLHSEQPPLNTLALPDFSKVSVLARGGKDAADPGKPASGILKREWVKKHRTRVPAVVAALFGADRVNGDPAQWLQVCTDLDNVKAVVRGRNIKLAVVLVQATVRDDVNEDLIIALKKRAEIDSKYIVTFVQNDTTELKKSLHRLAGMFAELSNTYYREEGRRIKTRIEKKSFSSIELHIRYCFKVAVFAEFRRDWTEALRFYDEAYRAIHEMIGTSTRLPPIQRVVEIKTIAEQLHFKVSTLLLHGGKVVEAITWFHKHISSGGQLMGPPEVTFLHWEWLSRQFLVFAELLETSSAAIPSSVSPRSGTSDITLTEWELQPAYYYQLSAHYLEKKRYSLEQSLSMPESTELTDANDSTLESIAPSIFVGQYGRLLEQGETLTMIPLSDAEYTVYAIAEGKRFQDSFEIIALFRKAFESFNTLKAPRMASFCGSRMAREHFAAGQFSKAKQVFDGIANIYRQEGWVTLLWENLGYLRECSRRLGSLKEFVEYSLEMAALPIFSSGTTITPDDEGGYGPAGAASLSQREIIQEEVFRLLKGEPISTANEDNVVPTVTVDQPIHLEVDPVSPLRAVFLASVAFHDQVVKPGASTLLTLSLLSQLPHPVEISELDIQFNQPACNFTIISSQEQPPAAKFVMVEEGCRVENAPVLILTTRKWLRLTYEIPSGQSGKLECLSVTAKLGPHCTVCCRAESPASMEELPLWKFDQAQNFPTKDPALSFFGQKIMQVEEPDPQVDLTLNAAGPALVGEIFNIPVSVISKGHAIHSGELKINLVDARGGGLMSPREVEPFSQDSHHVELLSVSGMTEEDEIHDSDNIRRIQHSFGLVSVPTLAVGESWSCNLEIKWHRAKPIMLYVSLGYCPTDTEGVSQRVNVHKSLQIEGKTPVMISHRFMLPFRCEPLLLSKIKPEPEAETSTLALNETNILIVSTKNCCEVPLQVISLSIEPGGNEIVIHCAQRSDGSSTEYAVIVPGEEFKQVFSVIPQCESSKLGMGSVCINVRRKMGPDGGPNSGFLVKQTLPDLKVEKPPLLVHIECPPYAVLGVPFTFYVRVQNQTSFLQEIKYSLGDSQSFVFSGPHNDTVSILPKSECIINYKLVPLGSGSQQLPQLSVTSVRYSAQLHPSVAASTIFVFPSQPHFDVEGASKFSDLSRQ